MCGHPPEQCTCYIQLGDRGPAVAGIIKKLTEREYLKNPDKKNEFTPQVREAVIRFQQDHGLACTGRMDDETLSALLSGEQPGAPSPDPARLWDGIYYVPTDGGLRFHSDPACCGMKNPRMISGVNAEKLGLRHCGLESCVQYSPLIYTALGLAPRILPDSYAAGEENGTDAARLLPSDDTESGYVGNSRTHVFHRVTCGSAKKMSEKSRVGFASRDEAVREGYQPCGICNP